MDSWELAALRRLIRTALAVNAGLDLGHILRLIIREAMASVGAGSGAILLYSGAGRVKVKASVGLAPEDIRSLESSQAGSLCPILERLPHGVSPPAYMIVPIICEDHIIGLIVLLASAGPAVTGADSEVREAILSVFAEHAAMAIELEKARSERQSRAAECDAPPRDGDLCDRRCTINLSQVSIMAHELRTPLTSTRAYTQLLLQARLGDISPRQKEALEVIERNILRMARIINDILDMARIREGRLVLTKQVVNLCDVVNSVIQEVTPLADARKIRIEVAVLTDITGTWDKDRIQQVFLNLLDNAIKFTPPEGRIVIRARIVGDFVQAEVSDNGKGISRKKLARIFEPFPNVDIREREPGAGMGLGLSICKGIVEAHGGRIWVESEEGAGSTFFFTLPLGESQSPGES
ncbi:MAG TPA: GAF domain-containing sensor histidine kinase [Firmicutes bacterium]|nr:GAF domain-containing sensor histidine kinase [Bacillota bacterium]